MNKKTSRAYLPYRGLGLVSNDVPLVVSYVKSRMRNLIITSVGNSFHTYEDQHLRLINVSNPHTSPITCLAFDSNFVYSATERMIYAWVRGTELAFKYGKHDGEVFLMLPFGPTLLAVDRKNVLRVWKIRQEELDLQMDFPNNFTISCMFHPPAAVDTVMFGSDQGVIQLWDLKTCKMLKNIEGWNSKVHVLEDTRTVDHVAIGLADGDILLYNWMKDSIVRRFKQECGPVISLSFRKDGNQILISGSTSGNIAIWDIDENKLSAQIYKAHTEGVTGIECIENEPLMITSSADNTLKMWIFDLPDGGARVLKFREGHSKPPLMARFHGSLGDKIVTSGGDSTMRVFSTISDALNQNLGSASYKRRVGTKKKISPNCLMPPIIKFASETEQNKPWDNIACIHNELPTITTWSLRNSCIGKHKLKHERFTNEFRGSVATAIELTVCGNFVFVGYDSGHIDKYNIQSGIYRGSLGETTAHEDTVGGIVCDGLNQYVISGDLSGSLKWWKFNNHAKIDEIKFDDGLSIVILDRDTGSLAVASENMTIYLIDVDTRVITRKFVGHNNQITDVIFSPDSKWIISSSLDCTIRTWDISSISCIDNFKVPNPAISLSMSPNREFLVTVHTDQLGVYLWAVRNSFTYVSFYPLPEDFKPPVIAIPSAGIDESQMDEQPEKETSYDAEGKMDDVELEEYVSPHQITDKLITLSLQPTSHWLNLLNIDTIKKRNKPIEAPKVPKAAPFFIPTIPGLELKFGEAKDDHFSSQSNSKILESSDFQILSSFGELLKSKRFEEALDCLCSKGPSAIDLEIKGLDPDIGGTEEVINNFLKMINYAFLNKKYFEVAQGYLGLFLKTHFDFIVSHPETLEICKALVISLRDSWQDLKEKLNRSLCLTSYFKNASLINY